MQEGGGISEQKHYHYSSYYSISTNSLIRCNYLLFTLYASCFVFLFYRIYSAFIDRTASQSNCSYSQQTLIKTKQCRKEVERMKQRNVWKWINEPIFSLWAKRKETERLAEALRRCKIQNALLWQLLEKHGIEVPESIIDPSDLDLLGKDAYILSELESINKRLNMLTAYVYCHIS